MRAAVVVVVGRSRRVVVAGLVAAGLVLVASGPVAAVVVHPVLGSFSAGVSPAAVAVDQATGDVFVADPGAGTVLKFDASGSPADFSAVGGNSLDGASGADLTPEGVFSFDGSGVQVAVDNTGGATDGYLYVTNSFAGVVDVFDATGTFVGEIDGSAATPQSGGEVCGVAVGATGDVYVSSNSGHVDRYTPTDADPAHDTFDDQLQNLSGNCNLGVDSAGSMFVSSQFAGPLTEYDPAQLGQASPSGTQIDGVSTAVAVDPATQDVYVDEGDHVAQYDNGGSLIGHSANGTLSGSSAGVGVKGSSNDLYVSDAGSAQVEHLGPGVDISAPDVSIDAPSQVTSTHATFTGTVNPQGNDPLSDTSWHFEYSTDGGNSWNPTAGGDAGTGTSPVAVSDEVSTLLPNQDVQVRLVATNAADTTTSSIQSFTTTALAPDVVTDPAQDIAPDHAVLEARLNAHNAQTTYYFEYGTTTNYGTSAPATQDADGGSSNETIAVTQALHNLSTQTTYHYRIVAHNLAGTVRGADQSFSTTARLPSSTGRQGIPGSGDLPDNRGWEQVSPPAKHGADILADSARTRAAATETPDLPMAATFGSLAGFSDVAGTGASSDYMAIRSPQVGTNGWITHGITPHQNPLTFLALAQGFGAGWAGDFSPDLNRGVDLSLTALTNAPNVAQVMNLYRRDDLRTAGAGSYRLLTDCPACSVPLPAVFQTAQISRLAGASGDFSHVIFESVNALTSDAPPSPPTCSDPNNGSGCTPNLYEWADGTVRLVGILPDSACGVAPPCVAPESVAGQGANLHTWYTPHTISTDGSRIVFTDISPADGGDGVATGNLYVRIDGASTVQLNASEKSPPDTPQAATFEDASADGTRVFFTTAEQLTDTPAPGGINLYMYDANAPAGHHLTLLSAGHSNDDAANGVQGVVGASADGHYVYFAEAGQLVAGEPPLGSNVGFYEWHDDTVHYIGKLSNWGADKIYDALPGNWGLTALQARVTPDGRHVLFVASSGDGLTGHQQDGHRELYVYDAGSQRLQCASCNPSGSPAAGDADDMTRTGEGPAGTSSHLSHAITDDGRRVFFDTSDALVPQDTNEWRDVYEFDTTSGTVHLLSSGKDDADSYFMDASANGDDAFFLTRAQLVGWDNDGNYDLYDARVGGGLPNPVSTPGCSGDPCHGSLPAAPAGAVPQSQTLQSAGTVKSSVAPARKKPVKCRRGYVRKRVKGKLRCVKKRPRARHAHGRRTSSPVHGTRKAG